MARKPKDPAVNPPPEIHNPAAALLASFTKRYGKGCASTLGDADIELVTMPFGIPALDRMLKGGVPVGRITEIAGPEGAGKTSLALWMCRYTLEHNPSKYVVYIDAENAVDKEFAMTKYGLAPFESRFVYVPQDATQPAEVLLDMLLEAANNPLCALVVLDSIGGLMTAQNAEKSLKDGYRDTLPNLLSRQVKKIGAREQDSCPVVLLNQLRYKMNAQMNEDPWMSPGGMSMRHAPQLRLRIRPMKAIYKGSGDNQVRVGFECAVVVEKGRNVKKKAMTSFAVDYEIGIDSTRGAVDQAIKDGLIIKRGSMYDLLGESYKGKEALLDALRANPKLFNDLLDNLGEQFEDEPAG